MISEFQQNFSCSVTAIENRLTGVVIKDFSIESSSCRYVIFLYTFDSIGKIEIQSLNFTKSVRNRCFSGPYFAAFGLNTDQKISEYEHFSHSGNLLHSSTYQLWGLSRFLMVFNFSQKFCLFWLPCPCAVAARGCEICRASVIRFLVFRQVDLTSSFYK